MSFVKQALVSLIVLVAAAGLFVRFHPAALPMLERAGISHPALTAFASTGGGQAGGDAAAPSRRGAGGGRPDPLVVTRAVTEERINDRLNAIGDGDAVRTVVATPTAEGTVEEIRVQSGARVSAGDVLARLDAEEERIAVDRARLAVSTAEDKRERYRALANSSAISSVEITNAEVELESARLELRQAELELNRRTVTAPIDGVVGIVQINRGDYVDRQTPVVRIDDRSQILVDFRVPERFARAIDVGMPVSASALALPGERFEGRVSAVDNRVEPDSRTLRVRAVLPNPDDRLRAGMSFSVTMGFAGDAYPAVDPLAVQWDGDGAFVWRVAEDSVARVPVGIVQRNPDSVLVDAALAPGEWVVTEGLQRLRPGMGVRIAERRPGPGEADANDLDDVDGGSQATPTADTEDAAVPARNAG